MPFTGLVEGQRLAGLQVRVQTMEGVGRQGLPGIVAPSKAAPIAGHEGNAAVRQGTRVKIILRAECELTQIGAVGIHGEDMKALPLRRVIVRLVGGSLGKTKENRPCIVRQRQRRKVALRQPAADQVAGLEREPRFFEDVDSAAGNVRIVVIVAEVFVKLLADESFTCHKQNRLIRQQGIAEGRLPRKPSDMMIQVDPLVGSHGFELLDLAGEGSEIRSFGSQVRGIWQSIDRPE